MQRLARLSAFFPCAIAVTSHQVRRYEYWGLQVTGRTAPDAMGAKLPEAYAYDGVGRFSVGAQSLTGSGLNVEWTTDMIRDTRHSTQVLKGQYRVLNGHQRYVVPDLMQKQAMTAVECVSAVKPDAVFALLLKDYPNLKTPLTAEVQAKIHDFYLAALAVAADAGAVEALAAPLVKELMGDPHYISLPYWWRIAEKFIDATLDHPNTKTFAKRSVVEAVERVTKILYNTYNDLPWASDDMVNPATNDVCAIRAVHEAGMW